MQKRDLDAIFSKLAKRHLIPKRDSVVDLTFRLQSKLEEVKAQAAQACDPCADRATRQRNSIFLRNLSDAVKAPLAYRHLTLPGLALLTFRNYYRKHRHIPRRDELKELTERVWCRGRRSKSIDDRQWRRVLRDDGLEELFAPVKRST
jgi:hypothetical protein